MVMQSTDNSYIIMCVLCACPGLTRTYGILVAKSCWASGYAKPLRTEHRRTQSPRSGLNPLSCDQKRITLCCRSVVPLAEDANQGLGLAEALGLLFEMSARLQALFGFVGCKGGMASKLAPAPQTRSTLPGKDKADQVSEAHPVIV